MALDSTVSRNDAQSGETRWESVAADLRLVLLLLAFQDDRLVPEVGRAVVPRQQRVLEPLLVLALLVLLAPVGAAELVAGERAERDGLTEVDEVLHLDGVDEVRVERARGVVDVDVLVLLADLADVLQCLLQALLVAEDVDVLGHRLLKLLADLGLLDAFVLLE